MSRAPFALGALALAAAVAAGCERAPDRPVARLGVEPAEAVLPYPGTASLDFAWEPLAPLGEVDGELRVFVHLLDEEGEIARTFDHRYPFAWEVARPSRHRLELYQSLLGPALEAGDYALTAGLYDASGRRWALDTAGEEVGRREYRVASVRVPEEGAGAPEIGFAGAWLPGEAGADRQILGRRWTTGDAALAVGAAAEAGELALTFAIPPPPGDGRLELAEGAAQPAARVVSDCDGSTHHVAGFGGHEIAVAVPAGIACRVAIESSFRLTLPEGPPRGLVLENLAWRSPAR